MPDKDLMDFDDDRLVFADEDEEAEVGNMELPDDHWTVMIVDDDESVHAVTRMVLADFTFLGRKLELISAYSVADAKRLFSEHQDISLVLLDVVMESEDSGLKLVRYIREQLRNKMTRIILRTGQPGQAPERQVIVNYDINDYKLKVELTSDKLFVAVVSALRSYKDLGELEDNSKSLERIIESSVSILKERRIHDFLGQSLRHLSGILCTDISDLSHPVHGFCAEKKASSYLIGIGLGHYLGMEYQSIKGKVSEEVLKMVNDAEMTLKPQILANHLIVPIRADSSIYMMYLNSCEQLTDWDHNLVDIFATNIHVAFDNLQLNEEIESTQKEIIYTLGEVAEARSKEMGHHVKRVSEYSRLLTLLLGLSKEEAEIVAVATPVHDIGKLTIPDYILNKPARLSDLEFEIMKTHAKAGYDILKNSSRRILRTAAVIANSHHEWWDGSGYPNGLCGEEIPLYGRIVALADVFDALGSKRVYKKAWTLEQIVQLIMQERGSHFDPKLVDLLVDNIDQFKAIRDHFVDDQSKG